MPGTNFLGAIAWGKIVWWAIILEGNCPGGNFPREQLPGAIIWRAIVAKPFYK